MLAPSSVYEQAKAVGVEVGTIVGFSDGEKEVVGSGIGIFVGGGDGIIVGGGDGIIVGCGVGDLVGLIDVVG